jgi:CHAT domain-containing protein
MGQSKLDTLIDEYLHEIRQKGKALRSTKELYSALLGGVDRLAEYRRLIVVPDQNLYLLSFESLRNAQDKQLVESHVVGYIQSTTVLHLLRTQRPGPTGGLMLLALGDVRYRGRSGDMIQRDLMSMASQASGCRHSDRVRSIGQLFSGKSGADGELATGESLKARQPLNQFRCFICSARICRRQVPGRRLGSDEKSPKEDRLLQDRIMNQISAELVALSACDSGFGKLQGQEGLSSLVRPL